MTTAPVSLQDLRRRIYIEAKAEKTKRFWGLYVHVAKLETLRAAYDLAKRKNGAPGIDGVTFDAIEAAGIDAFLVQLRNELVSRTYRPLRNRRVAIPKDSGKVRVLGIPAIRDRVVQGALKLIVEPVFEADFCDGSYGYRRGSADRRHASPAVSRRWRGGQATPSVAGGCGPARPGDCRAAGSDGDAAGRTEGAHGRRRGPDRLGLLAADPGGQASQ